MRKALVLSSMCVAFLLSCKESTENARRRIASEMEKALQAELKAWYPQSIDIADGGFLSTFTYDFQPTGDQDKMIVTQARHTWVNAKASLRYPQVVHYKVGAKHGYNFLRDKLWDKDFGGFYQVVDKHGNVKGADTSKTAYGNAFGIYALAAYYESSRDTTALNLAKKGFWWLEKYSHDPVHKGYFQHLQRDGTIIKRNSETPSRADTGYKDQNSSIHLLEAFTELYQVWPDSLLRVRLAEMLVLIRDTIVTPKGNLTLFSQPDWTPVSFADSTEKSIAKHHHLDHVSFGHDIETAYLLLEASHVLGMKEDSTTLRMAKKMDDHALHNGWDTTVGGFYDEGYYFKTDNEITITHDTKNWWAQAEGLNSLLLMATLHPIDKLNYFEKFEMLWTYTDTYLIDHTYGGFYAGGLDKQPEMKTAKKGHIWKATYHDYRSLSNCIDRLRHEKNK